MVKNLAIFASSNGSNAENICRFFQNSSDINVVLICSNNKDAYVVKRAEKLQIPLFIFTKQELENFFELEKVLTEKEVDFIILAGFLLKIPKKLLENFPNKIINIHPSLLPSFPGPQAYRQAYEHGVKIAGGTAHFVSMQLDEGPIIAQESFRIKSGMSLKQIIAAGQQCEAKTLLKAVKLYLNKRLDVHWGVVKQV